MFSYIFQDWEANRNNIKGRIVMVLFRLARPASMHPLLRVIWLPYLIFYKILVEWFMCIELPHWTKVGKGFYIG
ncbi:MAG TPA: serine acetyltransferase, partial [Pontibacter sp.]